MKRALAYLAGASAGLFLAACAGGGPSGEVVDVFPDDPTAYCTLCFSGSMVGPAEKGTKGSNPTPDSVASNNSPTFISGYDVFHIPPGNYPLTQSVLKLTANAAAADSATNSSGATLSVVDEDAHRLRLNVPTLNLDVVFENAPRSLVLGDGRILLSQSLSRFAYHSLGSWVIADPSTNTRYLSEFVIGHRTPATAVPTNGSATYEGDVFGTVLLPGRDPAGITGDASLGVNFNTGAINGTLNPVANGAWNTVSVNGSIISGTSGFTGTTSVTSVPAHPYALNANATGFFDGAFYGPNAEELGAVWSLHDGVGTAIGTIGARR